MVRHSKKYSGARKGNRALSYLETKVWRVKKNCEPSQRLHSDCCWLPLLPDLVVFGVFY